MNSGSWSSYVSAGALGDDYGLPDDAPFPATRVVHLRSGEPYDVYIGRANSRHGLKRSPFENPWRIGEDGTREEVIARFERWVRGSPDATATYIREHVHELRGKTLACWCAPLACHGDVLAALAEEAFEREWAARPAADGAQKAVSP